MAQLAFDANQVDPTNKFSAIPAGDYPVIVTASELKLTKDGTGQYLELSLEVQDGPQRGAKLWDRLNLHNNNPKAVQIAQRQLSQLCHSVGVLQVNDSEQLHHKPCLAIVSARVEPGREPTNEVKGYKAIAGAPVAAASLFNAPRTAAPAMMQQPPTFNAPPPQAASAPAFGSSGAPWMSKAA